MSGTNQMKLLVRRCRICGAHLSSINSDDICFCHPEHKEYNPVPLKRPPYMIGTNLMNHIAYKDDCDGWRLAIKD